MAKNAQKISEEGVDRNGLALFVFLVSFAISYAVGALILAALLESGGETLPRDSLWKIFIFWAMVIAPQLLGIAVALVVTRMAVRRFSRPFLFYIIVGLGLTGVCLYSLFLLFPPTARSVLLVILQAATAWLAFVMLRRGLRRPD